MKIQSLVYPHMTLLDMVGPFQAWAGWPDAQVQFVWKAKGEVPTDSGVMINATAGFDDAWTAPDILFMPGGGAGTFALLEDAEFLAFVADRGSRAKWITSVCSGSILLGAAGLLQGYRSTSHWAVFDQLQHFGAIPTPGRYVIDRNRASGGGVTAGIDFGLAILAKMVGEEHAKRTQLMMEYAPDPPFKCGTPAEAGPELTAAALQGLGGAGEGSPLDTLIRRAAERLSQPAEA